MKSRYFRHLFQSEHDGIIQTGSIWDNELDQQMNYIYLSGSYVQNLRGNSLAWSAVIASEKFAQLFDEATRLNLCILGSYTFPNIIRMLHMLKYGNVETVILPYITPLQRLFLAHQIPNKINCRKELIYFLDYPYECLRKTGVENIYFLYENGHPLDADFEHLETGYHFEMLDRVTLRMITEMEGQTIPVVKSGYILENQWLFYFGTFGPDIKRIKEFLEKPVLGEWHDDDPEYVNLERMMEAFEQQFGNEPYGSTMVYHGPINDNPSESNSLMMGKAFFKERGCKARICEDGQTCALRCQHDFDYEYLQRYKDRKRNLARMGFWLMGNVNLKKYLPDISVYFWNIKEKTRAITIPNCGRKEYWNSQLLRSMISEDTIYWILPVEKYSRPEVIMEIIAFHAYNRLVNINDEFGYCFSGYLVPQSEDYE